MKKYFWAKLLSCLLLTLIFNPIAECQTAKNLKTKEVKYDKIIFTKSVGGNMGAGEYNSAIILNADRSMLVMTTFLTPRRDEAYDSVKQAYVDYYENTTVQGRANLKAFNQIINLSNQLNLSVVQPKKPLSKGVDARGIEYYYMLSFLKDGVVQFSFATSAHQFTPDLQKLLGLFIQLPNNMVITNPHLPMSIEGMDSWYYIGTFTPLETGNQATSIKEICLWGTTEAHLLWNYLRKATIIADVATIPQATHTFYYPLMPVCRNKQIMQGNLKINGKWETVTKGETDGRYFRFIANSGVSITLDIGFNFFTHTLKKFQDQRACSY